MAENKIKNVLVTGAAGFLGSHIADELSNRGYAVTLADIRVSPWLRSDQKMMTGDITDPGFVQEIVKGQDAIYHLAALADLNACRTRPLDTVAINVLGTVQFLKTAVENNVKRFMFASTVYVYSREGGFYRCSKQACESYIEEFQRMYGLPFTIIRYGSLYGPRADESNGVFRLLKSAITDGVVRHKGGPHDRRDYIHVMDAARLSADALNDEYENNNLVITGNDTMKIRDLFYMLSEILGKEVGQEFVEGGANDGHYRITPYTFTPKTGKKLVSNHYVDMGQGLLQVIEEIYRKMKKDDGE
jgi:UDP-glucose 4-epimerase